MIQWSRDDEVPKDMEIGPRYSIDLRDHIYMIDALAETYSWFAYA